MASILTKIYKLLLLIFLYKNLGYASCKGIPSFVHLCRRDHPEFSKCFNSTLYGMLPHMIKGIPDMDIAPIDPLRFTTIRINTGEGMAVSLEVELSNGILNGLGKMDMKQLYANSDTVRFSVTMYVPYIRIQANYKIRGKVMLLNIDSKGRCDLNATDLDLAIEWYGAHYTEKGKKHIRFDAIQYNRVELQNMVLNLEDSKDENRAFIETVNKAINDNIDSLIEELDVLIKETVGEVSLDYFNRVYRLFPNEQLFPEN